MAGFLASQSQYIMRTEKNQVAAESMKEQINLEENV
jgi:hypothetical protein